jgi:hypothetical protein
MKVAYWVIGDAGSPPKYRTMRDGNFAWTEDLNEAIHFSRRIDAEMVSAEDEDAWFIERHEEERK